MNLNNNTKPLWTKLLPILIFGSLWIFFYQIGYYHFKWQESHALFRYTWAYFSSFWAEPAAIATYVSEFIKQWFHLPLLGSFIVSLLLFLQFILCRAWLKNLGFNAVIREYAAYLLTILMVFMVMSPLLFLGYTFVICSLFLSFFLWGLTSIKNKTLRISLELICITLSGFVFGGFNLILAICCIMFEWKKIGLKQYFALILSSLALVLFVPWFMKWYLFDISYFNALFNQFLYYVQYKSGVFLEMIVASLFIAGIISMSIWSVAIQNHQKKENSSNKLWLSLTVGLCLLVCLSCRVSLYPDIMRLRHIELLADQEEWEEVLELCDEFWVNKSQNKKKIFTDYTQYSGGTLDYIDYTKFALTLTHQLPERFFDYTKYGHFGTLYPDELSAHKFTHGFSNFYYSLGIQTETLHLALGTVTGDGFHAISMKKYILANLILGDFKPNDIFLNLLDQTFWYRDFVKETKSLMNDTAKLNTLPCIIEKRDLLPGNDLGMGWALDRNLLHLFVGNTYNQYAFEYVLMCQLINKKPEILLDHLFFFKEFGYSHIPRHFEEALLILLNYGYEKELDAEAVADLEFGGLHIRPETIRHCDDFLSAYVKYQRGLLSFEKLTKEFGDTYWYHQIFVEIVEPNQLPKENSYVI